jgi:hypothetical protein
MSDFFLPHLFEDLRRAGKILTQVLGKIGIDAFILFFQRYRQSKDLLLRQAMKISHGTSEKKRMTSESVHPQFWLDAGG